MKFRESILHNIRWKALSLGLAMLTWLAINASFKRDQGSPVTSTYRKDFPGVPITWLTSAANTNRYKIEPETVNLKVGSTVSERELQNLQLHDIHAFIDVSDTDDLRQFHRPIQIQVPLDLKVFIESYTPSNVSVERIATSR